MSASRLAQQRLERASARSGNSHFAREASAYGAFYDEAGSVMKRQPKSEPAAAGGNNPWSQPPRASNSAYGAFYDGSIEDARAQPRKAPGPFTPATRALTPEPGWQMPPTFPDESHKAKEEAAAIANENWSFKQEPPPGSAKWKQPPCRRPDQSHFASGGLVLDRGKDAHHFQDDHRAWHNSIPKGTAGNAHADDHFDGASMTLHERVRRNSRSEVGHQGGKRATTYAAAKTDHFRRGSGGAAASNPPAAPPRRADVHRGLPWQG